jgi:outer membrane protein TolC
MGKGIVTMRYSTGSGGLLVTVSMVALLSACAVPQEPFTQEQLALQASEDREAMFKGGEPLTGPLTVAEAIARAMKYNLDKRSKMMDEALALGQTDLDRFDLLPKITANAGYTEKSEAVATRSRDLATQTDSSSGPSTSADRFSKTADLTMSWNILDFGVTYYTAKSNADRALIAAERRRKAVHNLVTEVRFAFWRAAAYQVLLDDVDRAVFEARDALAKSRIVEKENLKAPAEALRYQKSLLETLRQLTAIQQELSTARIELAALINLPPGTNLTLAVPTEMTVPEWTKPLEQMEELAFLHNPDLREQGYLTRISVDDTRKAILRLLPGITFTAGRNYDYNSFLSNNHWYEAGAKLSWNLMNIVSGKSQMDYAETNEAVASARRIALRMAVLAQVHIGERQFRNAVSQYQQSDELWHVDRRLFEMSEAKTANDAQGILERVAGRASAIASQLRRFQSYAQVEQAFVKMQATLGQDQIPDNVAGHDIKALTESIATHLNTWSKVGQDPIQPPMVASELSLAPKPEILAQEAPRVEILTVEAEPPRTALAPLESAVEPSLPHSPPQSEAPSPNATVSRPSPDWVAQLASFGQNVGDNLIAARTHWQRLVNVDPLFLGFEPRYEATYRPWMNDRIVLTVGGERDELNQLCAAFKAKSRDCVVRSPSARAVVIPADGEPESGYALEVASATSQERAMAVWNRLLELDSDLWMTTPILRNSIREDGSRRVSVSVAGSRDILESLCKSLMAKGQSCFVSAAAAALLPQTESAQVSLAPPDNSQSQ